MNLRNLLIFSRGTMRSGIGCTAVFSILLCMSTAVAAEQAAGNPPAPHAFRSGERLTYSISWSNILQAGTAVMEVSKEKNSEGREVYRFVSSARSAGMVDKFYPVRDRVQSLFDAREMSSISYSLNQSHGKKKKQRELVFDHESGVVASTADGRQETFPIPPHTQDALSSLYYLRLKDDFTVGTPIVVDVFDGGKTWSVEVHTLGREKLKTPLGEFQTIKVKTYPTYEGVFMHKGEIFMWLTDDAKKVPVLMKSTITIGSIVATLTEMKPGDDTP